MKQNVSFILCNAQKVTFLLIGMYHTGRRIIKLSKSVSSVDDPMTLFQCLKLWQQPCEPIPMPEIYLDLSPVSVPWCLTTSLRSHFSFMRTPIWLLLPLYLFLQNFQDLKPAIRSWFQIYYGTTDKNPKLHCISLFSLGKHGKNKNVCQTTKTTKGLRSRCSTWSYFSFYSSLPN